MIPSFPKIFAIGSKQTQDLFDGEVEITEKIDGSAIGFGVINGELIVRSKGQQLFDETCDKMFRKGFDTIKARFLEGSIPEGYIFYGEYLKSNKHNVLTYGRSPLGNIMLYGVYNTKFHDFAKYGELQIWAADLFFEPVPLLYRGHYPLQKNGENSLIAELMKKESILGNTKIEGLVIKNYNRQGLINRNVVTSILMGKYVSEEFKEVHNREWKKEHSGKGRFQLYKECFRSEARWIKAIQHLREKGILQDSPRDIGALLKEIQQDIESEESGNIKEWLYNEFGKDIMRTAIQGFPEWYKERLLNEQQMPDNIDLGGS